MRAPLATIAALALLAAAPPSARGAGGETLRWKLEPTEGIAFKVTGNDPKTICDQAPFRTLYGADLAKDGRRLALPVGRPLDLAFHYLCLLPEGPVEAGAAKS